MTIIVFATLTRRDGTTRESFSDHLKNVQGPIFQSIDFGDHPLERYNQFHLATDPRITEKLFKAGVKQTPFDGATEISAARFEDLLALWQNEDFLQKAIPDEANYLAPNSTQLLIGETHTMWEDTERLQKLTGQPLRVTALLKRKEGLSLETFSEHWKKHYDVVFTERTKGLVLRYRQTHVSPTHVDALKHFPGVQFLPFDGLADMYFETVDDYLALIQGEEYKQIFQGHEKKFLSGEYVSFVGEDLIKLGGN